MTVTDCNLVLGRIDPAQFPSVFGPKGDQPIDVGASRARLEEVADQLGDGRSIEAMEWQRKRFRVHIRAARLAALPLVIHTRSASADTLAVLREEEGGRAGGVELGPERAVILHRYYVAGAGGGGGPVGGQAHPLRGGLVGGAAQA